MKWYKNKIVWASPFIAFAIIFIFSVTAVPTVQPTPKDLPIAVVNSDEGFRAPGQEPMNGGKMIMENVRKQTGSSVNWVRVDSREAVLKGMDEQEYYAALVIPNDFSAKQASLQTAEPEASDIEVIVNQGMNTAASGMSSQMLNGIVDQVNQSVRANVMAGLEKKGATSLSIEQAGVLANPIAKKVTNVHSPGKDSANGNSPMSLFQPLWMASLISSAIIFFALRKLKVSSRMEGLLMKMVQAGIGLVIALAIGFGLSWVASDVVGIHIADYLDTALFLSITSFSFFLMISAVLSILGAKGLPIFALMLFFGVPLLSLAPEMLPTFYREWVYPWLPMRFMVDGLREMFFFDKGLAWSAPLETLVWIGTGGLVVLFLSAFKPGSGKQEKPVGVNSAQH
jgi:YhgE/Pip-like protein